MGRYRERDFVTGEYSAARTLRVSRELRYEQAAFGRGRDAVHGRLPFGLRAPFIAWSAGFVQAFLLRSKAEVPLESRKIGPGRWFRYRWPGLSRMACLTT